MAVCREIVYTLTWIQFQARRLHCSHVTCDVIEPSQDAPGGVPERDPLPPHTRGRAGEGYFTTTRGADGDQTGADNEKTAGDPPRYMDHLPEYSPGTPDPEHTHTPCGAVLG